MATLDLISAGATIAGVAVAMLAGLALLRASWSQRGKAPIRALFGWLVSIAGVLGAGYAFGEIGIVSALGAFSVLAYAVIASGAEQRSPRAPSEREVAAEPEDRPTNWSRAIAKSLLAIVLAGVAAIGLGLAFAVVAPMEQTARIVIGGLLVPMLWGAGMAWTLCDAKLLRATGLLVVVSACAYAVAFLPRMLSV